MKRTWITPGGSAPRLCLDILAQPHILIAGSTGSGKSVLINSLIYTALYQAPTQTQFILIDPKRVELYSYKDLPHTKIYASEPSEILGALEEAINIMEARYTTMQRLKQKETTEPHIYVIIDELADLFTTQKRETTPLIARLAQLGRAAHIHLIAATQRPTKDIINGQIKVNMDSRTALRCPTAQDSRNIINIKGAETLPRFGYGYYLTPETMQPIKVEIPYTAADQITERVQYWITQAQAGGGGTLKRLLHKLKIA
jgi:S-DNA-T family DNA segregation ATPase FtsK/SpoIIIE